MDKINFDFIEIGSCDFDTLTQLADTERGIVIEPIKQYLDNLPDKPNVIKVNVAISPDDSEGEAQFYYIPQEVIEEHGLQDWLKGCNTLDKMHPQHETLQEYVKVIKVKKISLYNLLQTYNVGKIGHLKIDIEGRDTELLHTFVDHLYNIARENWPSIITFETNSLTPKDYVNKVVDLYTAIGYRAKTDGVNTILKL